MNYGDLIRDSFRITWRNRYLWFFGFFVSLGSSGSGGGGGNTGGGGGDFDEQSSAEIASISATAIQSPFQNLGLILILVVAFLLIFLIFFVLYVISQGGLTDSVAAIEGGQRRNFFSTWGAGTRYFWRVLGQILLFVGIVLLLLLIVAIPIGALVGGAFFLTDSTAFKVVAVTIAILVGIVALIVIFIPVAIVRQFARRTMVIGGDGVVASVGSSYRMFRSNLGRSLLVWLIQLGIMLAAAIAFIIAILIVGFILALPAILLAVAGSTTGAIIAGIIAGLILLPALIVGSAILGTFNHSYWTLAYLRMSTGTTTATPRVV